MNIVALKLIDKIGEKCKPDQVDQYDNTALIWACRHYMKDVALKIIDKYGKLCKPYQLGRSPYQSNRYTHYYGRPLYQYGGNAFTLTKNCMKDVHKKLIDKFGKDVNQVNQNDCLNKCVIS
jgi:hypothetical protein